MREKVLVSGIDGRLHKRRAHTIKEYTNWDVWAADYDRAPHGRHDISASEMAVLTLAVSLIDGTHVSLRHITDNLDYVHALHAATAIIHAAGYTQPTSTLDNADTMPRITQQPPLLTWNNE